MQLILSFGVLLLKVLLSLVVFSLYSLSKMNERMQ